jgi:predicted RNA methylase
MARRSNGKLQINDRLLDILAGFRCTGNVVHRHTETLDRKDYDALNEILEALGGKWNRRANGHLFPDGTDAASLLEAAMLTGSVADPRCGDFFETPTALAGEMVRRADVQRGASVLEPSAGHGRIALAAKAAGAHVVCVEKDAGRQAKLIGAGLTVLGTHADFLEVPADNAQRWDCVLMNPPFSREQDIAHVRHAVNFLRPGGRLVAIMSAGMRFRSTKAAQAFRVMLDEMGADVEDLPEGTFKESGTMVRTCMVTLQAA